MCLDIEVEEEKRESDRESDIGKGEKVKEGKEGGREGERERERERVREGERGRERERVSESEGGREGGRCVACSGTSVKSSSRDQRLYRDTTHCLQSTTQPQHSLVKNTHTCTHMHTLTRTHRMYPNVQCRRHICTQDARIYKANTYKHKHTHNHALYILN